MKVSNFLAVYLFFSVSCEGCIDIEGNATGAYGHGCYNDRLEMPRDCGSFGDDFDFTADTMCCHCGGGALFEAIENVEMLRAYVVFERTCRSMA